MTEAPCEAYLFVGGPLHGKFRPVPIEQDEIHVPAMRDESPVYSAGGEPSRVLYETHRYRKERFGLCHSGRYRNAVFWEFDDAASEVDHVFMHESIPDDAVLNAWNGFHEIVFAEPVVGGAMPVSTCICGLERLCPNYPKPSFLYEFEEWFNWLVSYKLPAKKYRRRQEAT